MAIVGIDGSGKTTAAKEVARRLQGDGVRARYFENAGLRPPLNWVAQRLGHTDAIEWMGVARFEVIEHRIRKAAMWRAVSWSRLPGERVAVMDRNIDRVVQHGAYPATPSCSAPGSPW